MQADAVQLQHFFHGGAQGLLYVGLRRCVVAAEIADVRFRQCLAVQLAVGLQRHLVDMEIVGRDHVVGQPFHHLSAELFGVHGDVRGVVGAQETFSALLEPPGSGPVNAQHRFHGGLDFRRFNPVAVDLDHVAGTAQQHIVTAGIPPGEVSRVIDAVNKGFVCFLRKVQVTADEGIFKTEFADLAVGYFLAGFVQADDPGLNRGLADGAGFVRLVDFEHADGETAFRAGVDIDQVQVLVEDIVGRLAADKEHPQEGAGLVAQHPDIGRGQEGDRDPFHQEEPGQGGRVLDCGVGNDIGLAAEYVQCGKDHNDGSHKVHRRQQGQPVVLVEGDLPADPDGLDGPVQVAEFMEYAFGISRGAGGVDGIGSVVLVRRFISGKRRGMHHVRPVVRVQLKPASAVFTDVVDPFRRIGILHQRPGGAGAPYADHGDHRHDAPRQVQQDEGFLSDAALLQVGVDAAAHVLQLGVGDAFGVRIVEQDRLIRFLRGILLQLFNDVVHFRYSLHILIDAFLILPDPFQPAKVFRVSFQSS